MNGKGKGNVVDIEEREKREEARACEERIIENKREEEREKDSGKTMSQRKRKREI